MKFPEQYRLRDMKSGFGTQSGDPHGVFVIPPSRLLPRGLKCIVSDGAVSESETTGWEHVSVSHITAREVSDYEPPTWQEMCWVKDLFWGEEKCVVQFHPCKKDYINLHPGVLHLWRKIGEPFPMPPKICV